MNNSKWTASDLPDMGGKTVLITGCSSGIGYETAKALAAKGGRVVMANRNPLKSRTARENILKEYPSAVLEDAALDLADLGSVRSFAEHFTSTHDSLNILVNNAGVMIPPLTRTADGFELQFGTNHLGHFALSLLLLPLLERTAGSRLVIVSSNAHRRGNPDIDDLNWQKRTYSRFQAYADSKIANLLFMTELIRRQPDRNSPLTVAAHPGFTATDLMRHSGPKTFSDAVAGLLGMPQWQGALPTLRACTDPETRPGDYYGPHAMMQWRGYPVKVEPNDLSRNGDLAAKLWEESERLTGVRLSV